jgi:hypothetical protein
MKESSVYEFNQKIVDGISVPAFGEKLVLELNESHDYDPDLIVSESEFRFEHLAHLFSFPYM